ncbi:hypothetical protein EUX98_g3455 [Antrodiella citrinella]|uniref:Fungal lipase-type domain-containing protein n=1 Tax=Antrodiella citrinella TaxID=2447956 RepID=A0A4S4N4M0_9APHY|nr:hypothetical protein EUX98_g3455 [Antrodiella citrinella]
MRSTFSSLLLLAFAVSAKAAAVPTSVHSAIASVAEPDSARRSDFTSFAADTVTTLSAEELEDFAPYTQFARAAYCPSSKLTNWDCGEACEANSGFQPTLTGGDGNAVQLYFVGYWPEENSVVVSHEGTDPTQFLSLLTDANLAQENLNTSLFPGVDDSVWVHSGFADQQALTGPIVLAETKRLIAAKGATTVTLVGHSLGGALAEMDAVYMTLNLPSNIHVKAVTYGTPRVGNAAWASFFDATVPDFVRVNNEKDLIPIVPGRGLGYAHPHGEVHIVSPGDAVACSPDDDATDSACTIATVPNIAVGNILNHLGPYEGIMIGTIFCT